MRLSFLLLLPLLVISTAGASTYPRGPLHPKSAAGLMSPAYLASPEQAAQQQSRIASNSGVLDPFAVQPLNSPARAAAAVRGLAGVSTDSGLARLGWSDGLTVTQVLATLPNPAFLAAGDLNGDALPDLAAIQRADNSLALALGTAGGDLSAPTQQSLPENTEALLAVDQNADCRTDLAFTAADGNLRVLTQDQQGRLTGLLGAEFINHGATDLAVGDLDHDGRDELAALRGVGYEPEQISLYALRNNGLVATGGREAEVGNFAAHAVAIGDVTNDGRADLVVSAGGNEPNAWINIFEQDASGQLATTPRTLAAWHLPEAIAIADLDHDSYSDVIVLNSGWLSLSLYRGQADGTLAPYETYALPYSPFYQPETLAVSDLNGDGGLDVLIADGDRGATYLLNTQGAPTATIDAPGTCAVIKQSIVTLTGTIANGTALDVSLDGGATWSSAMVDGATWSFTANLSSVDSYPVVLARAREGSRFQSPAAELRLTLRHNLTYVPHVLR